MKTLQEALIAVLIAALFTLALLLGVDKEAERQGVLTTHNKQIAEVCE